MNRSLIICTVGILAGTPAWAGATVEAVKSPVSINNGQGYQTVTKKASAANGDQVMAGAGGHARIIYSDGCVTDVYPGGVASVGKCYKPMTAGLEPLDEKALVPPPAAGIPWWLVGGTAAFIGVGICAASGCFDDDDQCRGNKCKPPKSP